MGSTPLIYAIVLYYYHIIYNILFEYERIWHTFKQDLGDTIGISLQKTQLLSKTHGVDMESCPKNVHYVAQLTKMLNVV